MSLAYWVHLILGVCDGRGKTVYVIIIWYMRSAMRNKQLKKYLHMTNKNMSVLQCVLMRSLINICKSCVRTYVSTSPGRHLHQTHTRACSRLQHTAVPGITTQQPGLGRYCRYCRYCRYYRSYRLYLFRGLGRRLPDRLVHEELLTMWHYFDYYEREHETWNKQ